MHWFWNSLLICLPMFSVGQNLVPNPSFEERDSTAVFGHPVPCPDESADINLALNWHASMGSVDYFHSCAIGSQYPDYGVPINLFGVQQAKDGEAYELFACFGYGYEHWREYIEVELVEPLSAEKVYQLSFFVSLPEEREYAISEVDALFTTETTDGWGGGDYSSSNPQVKNPRNRILNDKVNWMEITDTFTVSGGERFLTIGCFESYWNLTIDTTITSGLYNPGCAYYLDEVTLFEVGYIGVGEPSVSFNIYPNPTTSNLTIESKTSLALVWLTDLAGRRLAAFRNQNRQWQMDVSAFSSGIYLVEAITEDGRRSVQKVLVQ